MKRIRDYAPEPLLDNFMRHFGYNKPVLPQGSKVVALYDRLDEISDEWESAWVPLAIVDGEPLEALAVAFMGVQDRLTEDYEAGRGEACRKLIALATVAQGEAAVKLREDSTTPEDELDPQLLALSKLGTMDGRFIALMSPNGFAVDTLMVPRDGSDPHPERYCFEVDNDGEILRGEVGEAGGEIHDAMVAFMGTALMLTTAVERGVAPDMAGLLTMSAKYKDHPAGAMFHENAVESTREVLDSMEASLRNLSPDDRNSARGRQAARRIEELRALLDAIESED